MADDSFCRDVLYEGLGDFEILCIQYSDVDNAKTYHVLRGKLYSI